MDRSIGLLPAPVTWIATFVIGGALTASVGFAAQQVNNVSLNSDGQDGFRLDWNRVDGDERIAVFETLANATTPTYQRIVTWRGTYLVELHEFLPQEFAATLLRAALGNRPALPLEKVSRFRLRFVIDMPSNAIFRQKETISTDFIDPQTGEKVSLANVHARDENSVVTSEHYIHMSPTVVWPGFNYLPKGAATSKKRAAFRETVDNALRLKFGELIDPRDVYSFSCDETTFGQDMAFYSGVMRGTSGQEARDRAQKHLRIERANADGGVWFRAITGCDVDSDSPMYQTVLYNPHTGYNPVTLAMTRDATGEKPLRQGAWVWKRFGEVFVPTEFHEATHSSDPRITSYQRKLKLEECGVNEPIAPNQFDYQALGLTEGELFIDKIENVAYAMKDEQLEKLADFTPRYSPRGAKGKFSLRGLLIIATVLLIVGLLIQIWRER